MCFFWNQFVLEEFSDGTLNLAQYFSNVSNVMLRVFNAAFACIRPKIVAISAPATLFDANVVVNIWHFDDRTKLWTKENSTKVAIHATNLLELFAFSSPSHALANA